MPEFQSASRRRGWAWQTIGLSLLGGYAGGCLAANDCYWRGRWAFEHARYKLNIYAPKDAPLYWCELAVIALWLVLWANFARLRRARAHPWFAVLAPLLLFAFFARQQHSGAYACVG